jgi:hypothetical protein
MKFLKKCNKFFYLGIRKVYFLNYFQKLTFFIKFLHCKLQNKHISINFNY